MQQDLDAETNLLGLIDQLGTTDPTLATDGTSFPQDCGLVGNQELSQDCASLPPADVGVLQSVIHGAHSSASSTTNINPFPLGKFMKYKMQEKGALVPYRFNLWAQIFKLGQRYVVRTKCWHITNYKRKEKRKKPKNTYY